MLYFHDAKEKTVMCAPDRPSVFKRDGKGREPGIWVVSATIEYTSAFNYRLPNGRWALPLRYTRKEEYIASRDTEEEAVSFFIGSNYPMNMKVDMPIYENFRKQYEDEAQKNTNPKRG